ncbi:MAG: hypothetical protein QOJ91_866 [Sphingomonadales bacterium]|jgi:hypothetical protein|nr:hypothetical protein [Sphingomonadales bacterium]
MASFSLDNQEEGFTHDPQHRGYCVAYRENEVNHCPGCGRTHWYVGRVSAECGFCATALPLVAATSRGAGTHSRGHRPIDLRDAA